jgi:hypothetical protein
MYLYAQIFDLVTLTLVIDLHIENFNLGYIFWLVGTRALTFHMSVHCEDIFKCTHIFDLVTLTLVLDLLIKNFNIGYNF